MPFDPLRLFLQTAQPEPADAHASDLRRGDEPRLLQYVDVLLDARHGHVEPLGKGRNRRVGTPELLQHPAPGGVAECVECAVESGLSTLNHMVQ